MLTTDDAAKTKLCHLKMAPILTAALSQQLAGVSETAEVKIAEGLLCVGSACMAWRWGKLMNVYEPVKETANESTFSVHQELGGYCGLAGMPIAADKADPR